MMGFIREAAQLARFWTLAGASRDGRLELLRTFAGIVLSRPTTEAIRELRADAWPRHVAVDECFVCGHTERTMHRHHIIQAQHGGSNTFRNVVPLCGEHHAAVHPWLVP